MDNRQVNDNLIRFWDAAFAPSEGEQEAATTEALDCKELAPSPELYEAVAALGSCRCVLDYGCGTAWAAITSAHHGCSHVDAVDLGANIIEAAKSCAKACGEAINAFVVSPDWLGKVPAATYDGIVCSNVLDVVPIETAREILADLARVAADGATLVVGLNFYLSPEAAQARGIELVEGRYLFVNDVLRLNSMTDEEWQSEFAPYFAVKSLTYFAWTGESKPTRRLFTMTKRPQGDAQ